VYEFICLFVKNIEFEMACSDKAKEQHKRKWMRTWPAM